MKRLHSILGAALLLCALPAFADGSGTTVSEELIIDEGDNPNAPPGARELPILPAPAQMPQYWITIDLRPTAFSFNPSFMNSEMPTPIIPKGFGVKIIIPDPIDPDSECNTSQVRRCKDACGKVGKVFVACEVQFESQPDGTAVRTVTSTCMDPNDPHVAGSVINTTQIKFAD